MEEIRENKKKMNIFLIAYIIASMIFLVIFTIKYQRIYTDVKKSEYKKFERAIENGNYLAKDYSLETEKKFNLIINLYLLISFVFFMECYENNKRTIKILILIVLAVNIFYARFIYSKIQMETALNPKAGYLSCFSLLFFPVYEIMNLFSKNVLKKEYKIQSLRVSHINDLYSWFLTILNIIFAAPLTIFFKNLIYDKIKLVSVLPV